MISKEINFFVFFKKKRFQLFIFSLRCPYLNDILPDDIKEYSERVAFNSKQLFAELLKRKVYSDYADLNIENLNVIQEAVKYFDIGFAIDSQKLKENYGNKIIPVEHVTIGSELFFFDVKKREDFLSLSIEERNLRHQKERRYGDR